jgi:PhnB protein
MTIKQVSPYVNFDGTAREAIALYERVLGAKAVAVQRFSDMPGMTIDDTNRDRIIHAALAIGPAMLMLSDSMPGQPVVAGGSTHVSLDFDTAAAMQKAFDGLAAGGRVTLPVQDTFWGSKFGMVTDKFGVRWMLNAGEREA